MRKLLHLSVVLALLSVVSLVYGNSFGPPAGSTGAPGEGTCADAGCHDNFAINSGPGVLTVSDVPSSWNGDMQISVNLEQTGTIRWGYQATVLRADGTPVDTLVIVDPARTIFSGTPTHLYVSHNSTGTDSGVADIAPGWRYWWLMPSSSDWVMADTNQNFYTAAVAANGDGTPGGDYVYTNVHVVWPYFAECPLWGQLAGDVNWNGSYTSSDIIYLVNFVFRGGPKPLICTSNGDVNCDGPVNSADILYMVNYVFRKGPYPCDPCTLWGPLDYPCD